MPASTHLVTLLAALVAADYPAPHGVDALRITPAEHRESVIALSLGDGQTAAADVILSRYQTEFEDALEAWKSAVLWVDATVPSDYDAEDSAWNRIYSGDMRSLEGAWQSGARRLERRYFDELAALAAGSRERVEVLRRARFRKRVLAMVGQAYEPPYGADVDLTLEVRRVAPMQVDEPQVAAHLAGYQLAMESLLAEVDRLQWCQDDDRRRAFDGLREAVRHGDEGEIARLTDETIETQARLSILYWRIRQLNVQAADTVVALLSGDAGKALRDEAWRALCPFAYGRANEESPATDVLLRSALSQRDLAPQQREALLPICAELESKQAAAVRRLDGLYQRTIDAGACRSYWGAWVRHIAGRFREGQSHEEEDPTEADRQAFEVAVAAWQEELSTLAARIRVVLSETGGGDR